jgi:hypothetical protein
MPGLLIYEDTARRRPPAQTYARRLPPGKVLMPGLIAHSINIVEHPELVVERLMNMAYDGEGPMLSPEA